MKNNVIFILLLITLLVLTGCQDSGVAELQAKIVELEVEIVELKRQLGIEVEDVEFEIKEESIDEIKESKEQELVIVRVTDKINMPKNKDNWVFSDSIQMVIEIENNSDKVIKGIQGSIDFRDMFDVSILEIGCDLTGNEVGPGEKFTEDQMVFEINEFIDSHLKIYVTDFSDLIINYEINQVLFTDGTSMK
ncbi:MAG TPA: hypothetical protein VFC79_08005 [Tissierellaceae bacterium]|nr:hypothetical protein [Tissierellaceae bacterium]